jgi:hypothetical protein
MHSLLNILALPNSALTGLPHTPFYVQALLFPVQLDHLPRFLESLPVV